MTKLFFPICLILLIINPVFGAINVDIDLTEDYFVADEINIIGDVQSEFDGFFNITVVCDNNEYPFNSFDISQDIKKEFDRTYIIPVKLLRANCHFRFDSMSKSGGVLETLDSAEFLVGGEFEFEAVNQKDKMVLGESNKISAIVTKRGEPFQGQITMTIIRDDQILIIESDKIVNGGFDYLFTAEKVIGPGTFLIDYEVVDLYTHSQKFKKVITFEVDDKLVLAAETKKPLYRPGETVFVDLSVKDVYNKPLNQGTLDVSLDAWYDIIEFDKSSTTIKVPLLKNIRSGFHDITIVATDSYGNNDEQILSFEVESVPSSLKIIKNQDLFEPGDIIELTPMLYDQAMENSLKAITVIINPPQGDKMEILTPSNSPLSFEIESYAVPGNWEVIAEYLTLKDNTQFYVGEIEEISLNVSGSIIQVRNKGNIDYVKQVSIFAYGDELYSFAINKTIKPNATIEFDFAKKVESGTYDIYVIPTELLVGELDELTQYDLNGIIDTLAGDNKPVLKVEGLSIVSNKNVFESTTSAITGAVTGIGGFVFSWVGFLVLVIIVFISVLFLNKDLARKVLLYNSDSNDKVEVPEISVNEVVNRPLKKSDLSENLTYITRDDTVQTDSTSFNVLTFKKPPAHVTGASTWQVKQMTDSFMKDMSGILEKLDCMVDNKGSNYTILISTKIDDSKLFSEVIKIKEALTNVSNALRQAGREYKTSLILMRANLEFLDGKYAKFKGLVPVQEYLHKQSRNIFIISSFFTKMSDREYKLKKLEDIKSDELEFYEYLG